MADMAKMLEQGEPGTRQLYVIRHGSTALNAGDTENEGDRIRGWKDVPLSDKGKEQAKTTAKALKNSGIDTLYHSTLSRATDTAQDIAETTKAKLVPFDKLKPWNMGHLTGQESKDAHPVIREYAFSKPDEPIPGGESFNQFKQRTFDGLREILQQPDKLPGIVTHHRVERLIKAWLKAGQPQDLSVDEGEMLKHGESPAAHSLVRLNPDRMGIIPKQMRPQISNYLLNGGNSGRK